MRVLFDILHPAHVHFFRGAAGLLRERGAEVLFAAREKDVTVELLRSSGLPFEVLGRRGSGAAGLAREWVLRCVRLGRLARVFRPTVLAGVMGPVVAPLGRALGIPSAVFYDTETARLSNGPVQRWATRFITPESAFPGLRRANLVRYPGCQPLAYLHPNRFTPDPTLPRQLGLPERFALVRLVSWQASHDLTSRSRIDTRSLLPALERELPVYLSSEAPLPDHLAHLALPGPPEALHHLMAAATLYLGEGGTTAIEAALLGTPSILLHCDSPRLGVIRGLARDCAHFSTAADQAEALRQAGAVLRTERPADARRRWAGTEFDLTRRIVSLLSALSAGHRPGAESS